MKKIIINILFIIYFIITILVTHSLLSYNKYNISEFNNHYLLTLKENIAGIKKSDLLSIKKSDDFKVNDYVFYYDAHGSKVTIKIAQIKNIDSENNHEKVIVLDNEIMLLSEDILGTKSNTTSYPLIGSMYNILISKWGYLFIIIFPMLIAFIYEVYELTKEIKKKWGKNEKNNHKK